MNKLVRIILVSFCFLSVQCSAERRQNLAKEELENDTTVIAKSHDAQIPFGVRSLMMAYPDFVIGYENDTLLLFGGKGMLYDDRREKSFEEKLDDADPEDMFSFAYDRTGRQPDYLQDAGRSRCETLFKMMYGSTEKDVRQNLTQVEWFGEKVLFTRVNGAADSLCAVAKELTNHSELLPYLKSGGSFVWRKVRGANRQSAHSYGIAIDVGVSKSDYWLWKNPGKKETDRIVYSNRMPSQLVDIFERHGFIWGGRWYHYDTMHFEFRPEILNSFDLQ